MEAFAYDKRMWVTFKEHSGIEEANRDQEVLLQLLKNNAGPHIQQALGNGADQPENTYRSLVEWASKIENRLNKQGKPRSISAVQWVAEEKGAVNPKMFEQRICIFCSKPNHRLDQCWLLKERSGLSRQLTEQDQSLLNELGNERLMSDIQMNRLLKNQRTPTVHFRLVWQRWRQNTKFHNGYVASLAVGSIISCNGIKIRANLGGQLVNVLIDTGASCSCTDLILPLTDTTIRIQGIGETLMVATRTQPTRLDLGAVVLEEPLWFLPNNGEGTVLGMDIMQKYGFVIDCVEKQIEFKTERAAKRRLPESCIMSISMADPLQQMIDRHKDVWANHDHDCGLVDFEVCIEGDPPPPQKQYRIKPEAEAAVHEIVKQLEMRGIVRRCSSTANSPCLPVPKPNGKWRLCIDYQRLNQVLPRATAIVANPSTVMSQIYADACWFTVLDIKNGFWSLKVKREDQWKLAFTVNQIQYTWERMPQGFHNSPAIFHRAVAEVLAPLLKTGNVTHYVDDILVATEGSRDAAAASGHSCADAGQSRF